MTEYTKIADNGRQRLYQLSYGITKDSKGHPIDYGDEDTNGNKSIRTIMISDAHTHLERLAFPAILVNCDTVEQGVKFFEENGAKPAHREFKDKYEYMNYEPYVEMNFADIGGNMAWLTGGYGEGNSDLLMTDEEILDDIMKANEKETI